MARLNLTVPDEKKSKWEQAAKDHPEAGGNLSALVRHSVERELSEASSGGSGEQSEEVLTQLGEVNDTLSELVDTVNDLEGRVEGLEEEAETEPEIEELSGEVFDLLPDEKPGSDDWEIEKSRLQSVAVNEGERSPEELQLGWEGTPEGLAQALDVYKKDVEDAIDNLRENTHLIRSTDDGRYYKVA